MRLSDNTILITGGASGIGRAFAERFIKKGNTVIVCGRREAKLEAFKKEFPEVITHVCDLTVEAERVALFKWATESYPDLNVLVNNAGIQQRFHVLKSEAQTNWSYHAKELTGNIEAPFHLAMLFAPHFSKKEYAAILNVTSGLAFTPMAIAPIYSATKAALHSFTMSLRLQLQSTPVEVIEVAPPAVNTDLGGVGLHTFGEPLDEFADGIFEGLEAGREEIGYGTSASALRLSRDEIDQRSAAMYDRMKAMFD